MKTNILQVDLRTLTNEEFYDLFRRFRLPSSQSSHESMTNELYDRGFKSFGGMDLEGEAKYYGKFPTLEQYLNSLP